MSVDRKQQIIEVATKSFSQFGYKATTMDQIARLANVGKGTIYTFFKNKEELLKEIITTLIIEMKDEADKAFNQSLSFHQSIHRSLWKILEFRVKHQLTIKLFQEEQEMGTQVVMEVMDRLEQAMVIYLKEKIMMAVQSGEIQECDPELTAFIMLKLYRALIFDWEKHHPPLGKEAISRLFEKYIFKGLSAKDSPYLKPVID